MQPCELILFILNVNFFHFQDEIVNSMDEEFKQTETSTAWASKQEPTVVNLDLETKFLRAEEEARKMRAKDVSGMSNEGICKRKKKLAYSFPPNDCST